ncbi:MAG: hypothetical protein JWO62_2615 [Acidimicrobiaceae bacterium]|nr:hypothetical protein [Acidimicrobiaceae bacterium]
MSDHPSDPITPLLQGAIATHELFASYVTAGFTPDQALALVVSFVHAMIMRQA